MYRCKIFAVDDNPDILELLVATLEDEYDIATAANGKDALEKIKTSAPDLLILDYVLPDMEGPQICALLRKDPLFVHLPILMLTGKGETEDKVRGLEAGSDDYMVKPFTPQELVARVRMLIRRSNVNLDANPLTRLPGNVSITSELQEQLNTHKTFAVLYIDIDHFKALNDHYGFSQGDIAIKETARIVIGAIQDKGTVSDFIGHVGGDDFVIVTLPEKAEDIAKQIIADFDKVSPTFFSEEDRKKGYIESKGRDNQIHKFPFPTISIGIISNSDRKFNHIAEISTIGAEVKEFAKKFPESKYIFDRRGT